MIFGLSSYELIIILLIICIILQLILVISYFYEWLKGDSI